MSHDRCWGKRSPQMLSDNCRDPYEVLRMTSTCTRSILLALSNFESVMGLWNISIEQVSALVERDFSPAMSSCDYTDSEHLRRDFDKLATWFARDPFSTPQSMASKRWALLDFVRVFSKAIEFCVEKRIHVAPVLERQGHDLYRKRPYDLVTPMLLQNFFGWRGRSISMDRPTTRASKPLKRR